jgi:hypothetical protein
MTDFSLANELTPLLLVTLSEITYRSGLRYICDAVGAVLVSIVPSPQFHVYEVIVPPKVSLLAAASTFAMSWLIDAVKLAVGIVSGTVTETVDIELHTSLLSLTLSLI